MDQQSYTLTDIVKELYKEEKGKEVENTIEEDFRHYKAKMRQRLYSILDVLGIEREELKDDANNYAIKENLAKFFKILLKLKARPHLREAATKKRRLEKKIAKLEENLEKKEILEESNGPIEEILSYHKLDKEIKEKRNKIDFENYFQFGDELKKEIEKEISNPAEREKQLYLLEKSLGFNLEQEKQDFKRKFDDRINSTIEAIASQLPPGKSLEFFKEYKQEVIDFLDKQEYLFRKKANEHLWEIADEVTQKEMIEECQASIDLPGQLNKKPLTKTEQEDLEVLREVKRDVTEKKSSKKGPKLNKDSVK